MKTLGNSTKQTKTAIDFASDLRHYWRRKGKEDFLLAMERSPIKDVEIKHLLKQALTNDIHNRVLYTKGIDYSYYYEGYTIYKAEEL